MNNFEEFISENPAIAKRFWEDQETKDSLQYSEIVYKKLNLLAALINSLNEQQVPIEGDLIWSETILFKFLLHSSSFLNLFKKTKMLYRDKTIELLDEPTMIVMFRVLLENYLTFFYLFCDNISDDDKQFRMDVWQYSGIMQRSGFEPMSDEMKKIKEKCMIEATVLKDKIEKSNTVLAYTNKQQIQILKGIRPRLYFSWSNIISMCGLGNIYQDIYSYHSAYTHTEFHSIFQIWEKTKFKIPNPRIHMPLIISHIIICKCIIELTELFPSIKKLFIKMDNDLVKEVEYTYFVGINFENKN